ncbi:hypothetical protein BC940DRAFT_115625 [Gongronella butleri]|nr:hypothetical protein BC940DRAFT_115625 [Gongronella butleri]
MLPTHYLFFPLDAYRAKRSTRPFASMRKRVKSSTTRPTRKNTSLTPWTSTCRQHSSRLMHTTCWEHHSNNWRRTKPFFRRS